MENNTKKKSVLNLFNILSICVIIAAVVAALYFFVLKGDEKDTVPLLDIEYTVEFGTVRDEFVGNIKVGDVLIDAASQRTIGVVEGVEYNRSSTYSYDKDLGQIVAREYPDHSDFIVTVRAKGQEPRTRRSS